MSELPNKEEDFSKYLYTCPVCDRPFTVVVLQHLNTDWKMPIEEKQSKERELKKKIRRRHIRNS